MPKISVGVRIRPDPSNQPKIEQLNVSSDKSTVELFVASTLHSFTFDQIFSDNATQTDIFKSSTVKLADSALEGYNGCVFAYGQTGAGKTHTISGSFGGGQADYGVCAQVAFYLFQKSKQSFDNISFRLSILEIYNETLVDLLVDLPSQNGIINAKAKLNIIETDMGVIIPGLHIMPIDSLDDALTLLMEAQANRAVAEHQLNHASSRSHIIYSYYITRTSSSASTSQSATSTKGKNKIPKPSSTETGTEDPVIEDPIVHQSKLHVVDLAGSERVNKTGSVGTVQKEANYINRSLSYLEQVVIALSQTNRDHIPYRQSKLTYLLKDSLGGNSNTYLIACVWPKRDHAWETLSTLRFAARMKSIETHPIRNRLVSKESQSSSNGMIKSLQSQVELLKKELALRDFIHGYDAWLPELNKQQLFLSYKQCFEFIQQSPESANSMNSNNNQNVPDEDNGKTLNPMYYNIQPIDVHNLSQIHLMLHLMKDMIYELADNNNNIKSNNQKEEGEAVQSTQETIVNALESIIQKKYLSSSSNNQQQQKESNNNPQLKLGRKLLTLLPRNKSQLQPLEEEEMERQSAVPIQASPRRSPLPASRSNKNNELQNPNNYPRKKSVDNNADVAVESVEPPSENKDQLDMQLNNEYFQDFTQKTSAGKDLHEAYEELKETLKTNKKRQKQIVTMLNDQKYLMDEITIEINQYQQILTEKQSEREEGGGNEEAGEEEQEIVKIIQVKKEKLDSTKKHYRTVHQELLLCKEQINETQSLKKRAMNALLMAFNDFMKQIPVQSP
jgi:kinesin family protein 6/9